MKMYNRRVLCYMDEKYATKLGMEKEDVEKIINGA
jgi:hypothetical protein